MAAERLNIDPLSILDNRGERQVEFDGEVDGERRAFAVRYAAIEALSGSMPDDATDLVATFRALEEPIADAALVSLARNSDQDLVLIGEGDLPQTLETPPTFHPHPDGGVEAV